MRKICSIVLLSFCVSGTLWGQFIMTRDHQVLVGDEIHQISADPVGLQPGPSGANQTWDFSTLTNNGDPISDTMVIAGKGKHDQSGTRSVQ